MFPCASQLVHAVMCPPPRTRGKTAPVAVMTTGGQLRHNESHERSFYRRAQRPPIDPTGGNPWLARPTAGDLRDRPLPAHCPGWALLWHGRWCTWARLGLQQVAVPRVLSPVTGRLPEFLAPLPRVRWSALCGSMAVHGTGCRGRHRSAQPFYHRVREGPSLAEYSTATGYRARTCHAGLPWLTGLAEALTVIPSAGGIVHPRTFKALHVILTTAGPGPSPSHPPRPWTHGMTRTGMWSAPTVFTDWAPEHYQQGARPPGRHLRLGLDVAYRLATGQPRVRTVTTPRGVPVPGHARRTLTSRRSRPSAVVSLAALTKDRTTSPAGSLLDQLTRHLGCAVPPRASRTLPPRTIPGERPGRQTGRVPGAPRGRLLVRPVEWLHCSSSPAPFSRAAPYPWRPVWYGSPPRGTTPSTHTEQPTHPGPVQAGGPLADRPGKPWPPRLSRVAAVVFAISAGSHGERGPRIRWRARERRPRSAEHPCDYPRPTARGVFRPADRPHRCPRGSTNGDDVLAEARQRRPRHNFLSCRERPTPGRPAELAFVHCLGGGQPPLGARFVRIAGGPARLDGILRLHAIWTSSTGILTLAGTRVINPRQSQVTRSNVVTTRPTVSWRPG